jgi:hypothetical protein
VTLLDFLPGHPLPALSHAARDRQLYHARRQDGEAATMTQDGGNWQWRRLRGGEGVDAYGSGGWSAMKEWLRN